MKTILAAIDGMTETVVDIQTELVSRPALSPDNNGTGEREKADWIIGRLREMGVSDIREFNAPDERTPCGHRPNVAAIIPGRDTSRTFWIIAHMDVVPAGDDSLWDSDPWTLRRDGDTIIGRGVEDNHQGLVSGMLAAKAILDAKATPEMNFGLLMVADEETGNEYGLRYIADNHLDLFGENDLVLVPDFGSPDSSLAEVAEKSMFWLKVTVDGKQCHASTPDDGLNAMVAASDLVVRISALKDEFDETDDLFDPARSTFEPTKREANVENVNTIPGRDVFYVDARVLPTYDLDEIIGRIGEMGRETELKYGCTVSLETIIREQAAPPTPVDADIVQRVGRGVKAVTGLDIKPTGIGGGTVAAQLRHRGVDALVWSTLNHFAHQPNEQASIANTLSDAKVMAHVLLEK